MKFTRNLMTRSVALAAVLVTMRLVFSANTDHSQSPIDLKAALLVFAMPLFVLILFEKGSLNWRQVLMRARETLTTDTEALRGQLEKHTEGATGQYSTSHLLKMTDHHLDSFVRYAGNLVTAKFSTQEISRLLRQRIEAEDHQWQSVGDTFSFMAKMAPYFGMLATVIGMIKLLENMSDFTRISGSMALAMQGTLYGLVSFTLVYSPVLKLLSGYREEIRKRNEMVTHWFILVSARAESSYIREDLRSSDLSTSKKSTATSGPLGASSPASARGTS